jgi:hypothetical protein
MKILSWNCRGLGNPQTVQELRRMVNKKKPDMVFLMETKLNNKKMELIRIKLGFKNVFAVDSVGKSGGLALLWHDDSTIEVQNFSRRHINAIVSTTGENSWKWTGFYGHPDTNRREEAWSLLRKLSVLQPETWMVMGDFNEILDSSEKRGGGDRPRRQMEAFRRTLSDCALMDLGFCGPKFTWNNCKEEGAFIRERLDRGVANKEWCAQFPNFRILVEVAAFSDHNPILLSTQWRGGSPPRNRGFIYDASWGREEACKGIIKKVWKKKGVLHDTWQTCKAKLAVCQKELSTWKRHHVGTLEKDIADKAKKLKKFQEKDGEIDREHMKKTKMEMETLLEQEELIWRQRSKAIWLKEGDRNTKFFHASAKQRHQKNHLEKIKDEEGRLWDTEKDIGDAFSAYFGKLFTSAGTENMHRGIRALSRCVTHDMNEKLLAEFTTEEICKAIHQMSPLKSPARMVLQQVFFNNIGLLLVLRCAILFLLF